MDVSGLGLPLGEELLVVVGEVGDFEFVAAAFDDDGELIAVFGDEFGEDGFSFFVGEEAFGGGRDF